MDTQESFIFWIRLLIYIFPIKKEQCTKKCTQYLNSICLIHSSYHDFEAISAKQHKHNTILSTNRSTILTLSSMARECQHDKSISVMAPHQKSHPRPWKSTKEERWQSFQHRSRRLKRWKRRGRRERGVNFQRDSCSPAVKLKFPPLKRDSSSLSLSLHPRPTITITRLDLARVLSFTIRVINPVVNEGCTRRSIDRAPFSAERARGVTSCLPSSYDSRRAGGNFIFERAHTGGRFERFRGRKERILE